FEHGVLAVALQHQQGGRPHFAIGDHIALAVGPAPVRARMSFNRACDWQRAGGRTSADEDFRSFSSLHSNPVADTVPSGLRKWLSARRQVLVLVTLCGLVTCFCHVVFLREEHGPAPRWINGILRATFLTENPRSDQAAN